MVDKVDKIWFDGKLIPWEQANVHVLTHTLHYGLGVFEGIRCYKLQDGRSAIFRLEEHIRRLFDSAHISMLPMPYTQEQLVEACLQTVRENGLDECYLRPIAFMGDAGLEMVMGELGTLRDLEIPLVVVVFVDRSLALIELKQRQRQLTNTGVDFAHHDFAAMGRAFGGNGFTVTNRNELRAALTEAQTSDKFTVIAAVIERGGYDGRI